MAFGKFFLLPWMGATLFGYCTYLLKNLHNFAGPLFVVSLVIMVFTFLRDNCRAARATCAGCCAAAACSAARSRRRTASTPGEKLVFWGGVLFLGLFVVGSGSGARQAGAQPGLRRAATMQVAHMVHAMATVLMMAVFLGHIYIGTIGMRAPTRPCAPATSTRPGPRSTTSYWYDDIKAGKIPAAAHGAARRVGTCRSTGAAAC
jgi:formate dehydrogenase subunit gamma